MNEFRRRVRRGVAFLMIVTTVVWLCVVAYHAVWGFTVSAEGVLLHAFGSVMVLGLLESLAYLATMAILAVALLLIRDQSCIGARKAPRT